MRNSVTFNVCSNGLLRMYNPSGEIICTVFTIPTSIKSLVSTSILIHGEPSNQQVYKWFTEKHQITPSNALKVLRGYVSNEITKKYPHWFAVVRSTRFIALHGDKLGMLAYEPDAEQAVKDGIKNISPLIIALQRTPKELKEYLGKGLWKALCKNSYSRNLLIARQIVRKADRSSTIKYVEIINKFPSTLLKVRNSVIFDNTGYYCTQVLKKEFDIPYSKFNDDNTRRNEVFNTVRDTVYELRQEGKEPNFEWSYRRFKEEHESLIRTRQERYKRQQEAQEEKFKVLKATDIKTLHKKLDTIEFEGCTAVPLTSFDAVRKEGDDMHHCVGSYAIQCANGSYLVYSITDSAGVRSTLGITAMSDTYLKPKNKKYHFSQHYHACNKPVIDKNVLTLANKVLEYLNS